MGVNDALKRYMQENYDTESAISEEQLEQQPEKQTLKFKLNVQQEESNKSQAQKIDDIVAEAQQKAQKEAKKEPHEEVKEEASVTPKEPEETLEETLEETSDEGLDEETTTSVTQLMKEAETFFEDEWLETYEKGQRSRKDNQISRKIKAGRFRINKNHQVEILPDKKTDGLTSDELLDERWL